MGEHGARPRIRHRRALAQHREPRRHRAHLARLLCDNSLALPSAPRGADPARRREPAQPRAGAKQSRDFAGDVLLGCYRPPSSPGLDEMTRRFQVIGALIVLTGLLAAAPAGAQDAQAFVAQLGNQAIQVLGPSVSPAQRVARFRQLFRDDFDVPGLGQFVLGRYWRTATPEEQQEFLRLFQEYIVQSYAARLGEYGGEPFRVIGSRASGGGKGLNSENARPHRRPGLVGLDFIQPGAGTPSTPDLVRGVPLVV